MITLSSHIYTTIFRDEVRLLKLLPNVSGVDNAAIKCDTYVVSLSTRPQYEALSYVWGGQGTEKDTIWIAGTKFEVTKNLHNALCNLRLRNSVRTLWIDQICINQDDPDEKSWQVQMMLDIYRLSLRCLAWMGEIRDDIELTDAKAGLEFCEYMAILSEVEDDKEVPVPTFIASLDHFKRAMRALRSISNSENLWWTRIWTVQEAVLPPNLCLVWGPLHLEWNVLSQASENWISGTRPTPIHYVLSKTNLDFLDDLMCQVEVATHYASNTIDLISCESDLRPLAMELRILEDPTPGIPHWALDLKACPSNSEGYYPLHGYPHYNAANDRPMDRELLLNSAAKTKMVLSLKGILVDTIKFVEGPQYAPSKNISNEKLVQTLSTWAVLANCSSGIDRQQAFGRMLIGDFVRNDQDWVLSRASSGDAHDAFAFATSGRPPPNAARQTIWRMVKDASFFITEKGAIGLGNRETKPGDEIWIFYGGKMPFTIKKRVDNPVEYDFIGRCYVDGIMFGEAFEDANRKLHEQIVRLH
ncbi:putative heterokaryon incompatibility protein [Botrytis cinerea BcDW1]|nr:putative heterokaryon incompatibility protein [Botrytis cinerea BcDW1]